MILWHLGATVAIARYVFRDPNMDLRFVMFGAVLPDLVDKPIGSVVFNQQLQTGRVYAHALLFPALVLTAVMLFTRRGSTIRKGWLGVPIGSLLHLFLDGQWAQPDGFWWPFLGGTFPPENHSQLWALIGDRLTDPLILLGEAVGLAYLVYLYRAGGLADSGRRARFRADGTLPLPLRS